MAIGSAVQRGSLVYVYDEKGCRLTSLLAGKGPKDGLQGNTSATVGPLSAPLFHCHADLSNEVNIAPGRAGEFKCAAQGASAAARE
jgi:hypothetical protein